MQAHHPLEDGREISIAQLPSFSASLGHSLASLSAEATEVYPAGPVECQRQQVPVISCRLAMHVQGWGERFSPQG